MVYLPIKKVWFDMIVKGEKLEEYRAITPRYSKIFDKAKDSDNRFWCIIRNGYRKDSPSAKIFVSLSVGFGKEKWGAIPGEKYFVLSILKVE